VIDPTTNTVIAGARTEDGNGLIDVRRFIRTGQIATLLRGQATTIGVVATNARLTKTQASKMAQMAHDGLARVIEPVHTPVDGDTIFALATGDLQGDADLLTVGSLGAQAISEAVLRAVRAATGIPGFPAARDLKR
jgi:L-aminopeptidase/D-esterase-like protein